MLPSPSPHPPCSQTPWQGSGCSLAPLAAGSSWRWLVWFLALTQRNLNAGAHCYCTSLRFASGVRVQGREKRLQRVSRYSTGFVHRVRDGQWPVLAVCQCHSACSHRIKPEVTTDRGRCLPRPPNTLTGNKHCLWVYPEDFCLKKPACLPGADTQEIPLHTK